MPTRSAAAAAWYATRGAQEALKNGAVNEVPGGRRIYPVKQLICEAKMAHAAQKASTVQSGPEPPSWGSTAHDDPRRGWLDERRLA